MIGAGAAAVVMVMVVVMVMRNAGARDDVEGLIVGVGVLTGSVGLLDAGARLARTRRRRSLIRSVTEHLTEGAMLLRDLCWC